MYDSFKGFNLIAPLLGAFINKEEVAAMKKLVQVQEIEGEGLESLMGENVILFCGNYFWAGKLIGVNAQFVLLDDAGIVYETGDFSNKAWKDFQKLGNQVYVMVSHIEAFAKGK